MTLEIPPEVSEVVKRTVTVSTRTVPMRSVQVGHEIFVPVEAQNRFLEVLLTQPVESMDLDDAARSSGCERALAEWRLQPGFVKWVETYLEASSRLDMAVLRRKALRVAIQELDSTDPELKPKALPLVAKLWPAAKVPKNGDDGMRVTMSATEVFKKLTGKKAGTVSEVEEEGEANAE